MTIELEIETMAVEVEDWVIAASIEIPCPAFFSNAWLKSYRATHYDTNINIPPPIWYGSEYFCSQENGKTES